MSFVVFAFTPQNLLQVSRSPRALVRFEQVSFEWMLLSVYLGVQSLLVCALIFNCISITLYAFNFFFIADYIIWFYRNK